VDTIDQIREFNRFYTSRIGLVGRKYVSGGLSLSELRVLYELGQNRSLTARWLAGELHLDEGYLSRMLTKFTKHGWLQRTADKTDRRVRHLKLTASGQAQAQAFVDQARARIGNMITRVDAIDKARLIDALHDVQTILGGVQSDVTLRDIAPGDAGWLIQTHAEIYHHDYGFDHTFEALVAEILADFLKARAPQDRAFIAERDGQRLGSIFCKREDAEVAKLRLFLLVEQARGLGLGHRLIDACVDHARACGFKRMVLWTQTNLTAACALYARHGFQVISQQDVHEFGQDMTRQYWQLRL